MSERFIFVTSHAVNPGGLKRVTALSERFREPGHLAGFSR